MPVFIDQLNRKLDLDGTPRRIISLVPSQTELLYDMGLREEVVGITKFCIHPEEWFRSKARVGGTKKYDLDKIRSLQPDLVIGNKEENEQEQIEALMQEFPVWMSDIYTLKDAYDMIMRLGTITGKATEAAILKLQIEAEFRSLSASVSELRSRLLSLNTAYFIWREPYMVAGNNTFIDHLLSVCGLRNVFSDAPLFSRYPQVDEAAIRAADPGLILLSSEPYPFKEKHVEEFRQICPEARILTVDGEMFSWYGSRLLHAPAYMSRLIQSLL